MKERKSVTAVVAGRYRRAGKKGKGQILDEFTQLTGYNRSYASWERGQKNTDQQQISNSWG